MEEPAGTVTTRVRWPLTRRVLAVDAEAVFDLEHDPKTATPEDYVRLLVAIRETRSNLSTLTHRIERELLAVMGDRRFVVEGVGEVICRKATKRTKWDHHALMMRVVARALDERILDASSGEYESEGSAVARVMEACARPNWRVTALRELGIDPDEWCEVDEDAWSVQLPGRDI